MIYPKIFDFLQKRNILKHIIIIILKDENIVIIIILLVGDVFLCSKNNVKCESAQKLKSRSPRADNCKT